MRPSTLPWRLSLATSLAALLLCPLAQATSSVNVALEPSFNAAPFIVELLETAASENSTVYFPLLDRIAEGVFSDLTTEKEVYDRFIDVLQQDGHLRTPESLSSFKFALSLHAAAPRIEAHFQYYNTSIQSRMMVAQDAACPVWVHFDDQQYCSPALERAQQPFSADVDEILPFDRMLGSPDDPPSVLYADITHPLFSQFHSTVSQTAREGKTSYRVRYRPSSEEGRPLVLSGYGVELNLKRTDYIVINDRSDADETEKGSANTDKAAGDEELAIKPLTSAALSMLGVNTAGYIISSPNPLEALVRVTSDLPKYSHLVSRQNVSTEFLVEHQKNREQMLPAGYNVIWINGLQIEPRQVNAYSLLDHLRRERKLIGQMEEIGLTPPEAVSILSHDVVAQAQADDTPQRFDWRDQLEGGNVIIWMNDLEQDKRYEGWPTDLTALFQRQYPGQLPSVARDIHNLIVPVDLTKYKDVEMVTMSLQNLVKRNVPVRIGLVPAGNSETSIACAKLSYHIVDTYGLSGLLAFYQELSRSKKSRLDAEKVLASVTKDRKLRPGKEARTYFEVLANDEINLRMTGRDSYLERLELVGAELPFILNGVVMPRGENWFELLSSRIFVDLQSVQQAVYQEAILEDHWVPNFFLFEAVSRRNGLVIPPDAKSIRIVDVPGLVSEHSEAFSTMPVLPGGDATLLSDRAHVLLVADLDSDTGKQLLLSALNFKAATPEVEILIVHSGESHRTTSTSNRLYQLQHDKGRQLSPEMLADLEAAVQETAEDEQDVISDDFLFKAGSFWLTSRALRQELGLKAGENALWLNGRLVGPIMSPFLPEDFKLLLDYERASRIAPATIAITGLGLEDKFSEPLDLAKITSVVARSQKSELPEGLRDSMPLIRLDRYKRWNDTYTAIRLEPNEAPTIQVVAVIDPASETGQSWIPILQVLSELAGVNTKIFLNPKTQITELPVKRFYRQVLSAAPAFNADGSLAKPRASFDEVPQDTLVSLGMIVPPSWLVAPKESVADLDNIIFSPGADQDIEATYELEYILIEGHARDVTVGPPPRGAQLLLGTEQEPHFTDTIVMANLGYFQFKANPGHWKISLKPGRSSKIFHIDSVGPNGYAAKPGDQTRSVALLSFQGLTLYPRLSRKAGMEEEDVLEAPTASGSVLDYLNKGASLASSALSSLGFKKPVPKPTNADINIFSVASGHLYERMLNIMMLSVMHHTNHTVKFWFIEQFLSPSFKATLPSLAAHYGFQYEMVMYKWPHWLRAQREKQREIWGYKILFLDVLFPLDLDKVIFVDADQIVRTDMFELTQVDLHGAPYGFTPMCDSREEMEGFRFWKQGYWNNYLRGKPYHISALYVVDLKTFRALAAGDRLRQQYQALSADPNSLSNLDQDLPNHMQHALPIHSLDQDWLWCETWCSDESLERAKTIDLCNNPLTKERKLERAKRQVPEWMGYDEEIAKVIKGAKTGNERVEEVVVDGREGEKGSRKDEL